ncbi:mechanosensitive ion channel family protein [Ascidiimonas sp. W6]|uniref:mechanosensitive ion channel family protein n=1 Tax=Ascidiimonas meishanensis TaxID=3128903 RepID=UPI0030EEF359
METLREFLEFELIILGENVIRVYTLLTILFIFLVTKLVLWLIKKTLFRKSQFNKLDRGNIYALFQIIKYVIWVIAVSLVLETIGINVTVLIAGSAALLVGVGLGLQQTFNDVLSGIILLSEKSIRMHDILEIDGDIVKIQSIGLRTSKALNRDDISVIIPNSLITNNKVINWSHQAEMTRFKINVGVAYGSDVDLVIKILEESALEHPKISNPKFTEARLMDFGNSSLDFQVLFYSEDIFGIEKIKSDIRRIINKKFAKNNIAIPFPQMDLHLKSNATELFK